MTHSKEVLMSTLCKLLPLEAEWCYYYDKKNGQIVIETGCSVDEDGNLQMIDPEVLYEDEDE